MSIPNVSGDRSTIAGLRHRTARILSRSSIDLLRISLGLIFVAFAVPKFFPGLSPVDGLVGRTVDALSLGLVPDALAVPLVGALEVVIGVALIAAGPLLVPGLIAMSAASTGFFAPIMLFPGEMFSGGPTLELQYILKDLVLVAAALVVGAKSLGARLKVE